MSVSPENINTYQMIASMDPIVATRIHDGRAAESAFNHALGRKDIHVVPPNRKGPLVDQIFYRIPKLKPLLFGCRYDFDVFASREMLTMEDVRRGRSRDADVALDALITKIEVEHKIPGQEVLGCLRRDIERIVWAADRGDADSFEALVCLHEMALEGGKIAYVTAHGYGEVEGEFDIYGDISGISANNLVHQLTHKFSAYTGKYNAIFLGACNPMHGTIDTRHVPVVSFTGTNAIGNGYAKAYFPK